MKRDIQGQMCPQKLHVDSKVVDGCEVVKLTAHLLLGKADGSVMADGNGWHVSRDLVTVLMDDPLPWAINIYHIYIYMYTVYYCIAFYIIVSSIYQIISIYVYQCISLYIII